MMENFTIWRILSFTRSFFRNTGNGNVWWYHTSTYAMCALYFIILRMEVVLTKTLKFIDPKNRFGAPYIF